MDKKHKEANHETQQRTRKPRVFPRRQAQCCGKKASPHKERPEHVSGDPSRHHSGDDFGSGEMLRAEHGHRNGDEQRAQGNKLIQPLPVSKAIRERVQANDQNDGCGEVGEPYTPGESGQENEKGLNGSGHRQGETTFSEKLIPGNSHSAGFDDDHSARNYSTAPSSVICSGLRYLISTTSL